MKINWVGAVVSVAAIGGACAARADATPPPKAPTGLVYAGHCYTPALNAKVVEGAKYEGGFLAGILSSVGTTLLGDAFDWVGAGLAKLGEDQTTAVTSTRTSEAVFNDHYCLQVVRLSDKGQALGSIIDASGIAKGAAQQTPAAPKDLKVDFFVEFWVRMSKEGGAVSLTPTLLYYPEYLNDHGSNKVAQFVEASLGGSGSDASSVTWAMPAGTKPSPSLQVLLKPADPKNGVVNRLMPSALSVRCETACDGASPWIANPWKDAQVLDERPSDTPAPPRAAAAPAPAEEAKPAAKAPAKDAKKTKAAEPAAAKPAADAGPKLAGGVGPAAAADKPKPDAPPPKKSLGDNTVWGGPDYAAKAVNIQVAWTEVRDGSKFWKTVADLFNAQKPTLEAKAGQALFSDQAAKAKIEAMTASATALATFSTAMSDAETQRTGTYCPAAGVAGSNWTALSAALRAKQLTANVAAAAAGQPLPFDPIAVDSKYHPEICPVAAGQAQG